MTIDWSQVVFGLWIILCWETLQAAPVAWRWASSALRRRREHHPWQTIRDFQIPDWSGSPKSGFQQIPPEPGVYTFKEPTPGAPSRTGTGHSSDDTPGTLTPPSGS